MSSDEEGEIIRFWNEGVPVKQIAYRLGYKPGTIYKFAYAHRDACPRRIGASPRKLARMWELRESGMTWANVAAELGVGTTTLDRWRKL